MDIKTRILTLSAAGAIVFAGVASAAGPVSAQEPADTQGQTRHEKRVERRATFLGRVASTIGVTLDELKQAFKSAATEAVDDALASGEITQEQADGAKARIENGGAPGLRRLLAAGHGRRIARQQRLRAGIIQSAATALNMSPQDLKAQLKTGMSIASVAGSNLDAVKAQITSDAAARLDETVAAGKLTRQKADDLLQKLIDSLDAIVHKTGGQRQQSAQ